MERHLQSLQYLQVRFYDAKTLLLVHDPKSTAAEASSLIAVLTLNDPSSLNAYHLELTTDLLTAFRTITVTDLALKAQVRVIILTGAGRAFSAGGDRRMMGENAPPPYALKSFITEQFSGVIKLIVNAPQIVISAVHGPAMGVAFFTVLASDYVVAMGGQKRSRSGENGEQKQPPSPALFNTTYMRLGLVPLGVGYYLAKRLGHQKALELCAFSKNISAEEGYALGFVNQVVVPPSNMAASEADLQTAALQAARKFCQLPCDALSMTKKLLRDSATHSLEDHMSAGSLVQPLMIHHQDHRQILAALTAKTEGKKSKL